MKSKIKFIPAKRPSASSFLLRDDLGFTLIELLVVISILTLLASILLVNVNSARLRARIVKTQTDIKALAQASQNMAQDTGRWPNGCTLHNLAYTTLTSNFSIFFSPPNVGDGIVGNPLCQWAAADIQLWAGPYLQQNTVKDAWGNWFTIADPTTIGDFRWGAAKLVLVSPGPDGSLSSKNDNIVIVLE